MKESIKLFFSDLKNISTNWVAAILIGGLILLPSLYAWMNIQASWDPYGKTENIKIGIVNEDTGATVRDEAIHVGDDLVTELKKNETMDWQFVSRQKAKDELELGNYYAYIVIPEHFSENLGTVISDQPKKANVEYFVNEKINAIAPKITDKGAGVIVEQMTSQFISTVNGVIFTIFNDIGIEIENATPDIQKFEDYIFTLEENLPEISQIITESLQDAGSAGDILNKANNLLPEVENGTDTGLATINDTIATINTAKQRFQDAKPTMEKELESMENAIDEAHQFIDELMNDNNPSIDASEQIAQIEGNLQTSIENIQNVKELLELIKGQNNEENTDEEGNPSQSVSNETIDQAIETLTNIENNLQQTLTTIQEVNQLIQDKEKDIQAKWDELQKLAESANKQVDSFLNDFVTTVVPKIEEQIEQAENTLTSAQSILEEIKETIPELYDMLNRTKGNLNEGTDMLQYVNDQFPYVSTKVNELADKIREIQGETDLKEIIELLKNDPDAEKSFFEEPVLLETNKVFPIANYGTGMTPFYTILAIWVGGLLLISLLSTEPHLVTTYTDRQMYFGRLMTFYTIGILQTLIVTLGDLFLLKVDVAEPFLFVVFGLISSVVFITIVYTLVSVFGDVGKALAIVLLVLQIAGAGGTYPVDLLPDFFQFINPMLPFTYAIDLMREAVGGIVWQKVTSSFIPLVLFGVVALIIGTVLKAPINKYTNQLRKKAKESDLFH